jgi:ElaB/YqjD/DUF883 family membrane-anchored ribosome-binding protein
MSMNAGAGARAQNTAEHANERVKAEARDLGDTARDFSERAADAAQRHYEQAQDMASDALDEAVDGIRRNPLAAVGIGFGLGFLFGVLVGGRN